MIAAWNYNLEEWEMKYAIGIDEKEASDFTREHSERLFESRTTQTYEGKYLLPLKREGYSAIVVLYDVVPKSDPEWYKLLSLLGMTVSEVLSFSCSTADVKRQDEFSSLSIALSKISNECKTHLKELLDYADMLKNVLDGNKDNSKLAEGIINSARFMVKQMDDILLYTGKGVADFSKLDIKKIAEEAAKELNPPEIDLAVTVSGPEKAEVSGNEKMLKTLFTCLAGNSAQAAESAGMEKVDFEIKITLEDKKFILRITDNGPGIPVDIRKKLFEPFSVSGEKKGRLGIGLALCRQIAEAHRGNISYDINYDSGARFKIKIPAFSDDES
jgi:signal transduction histidine kinase